MPSIDAFIAATRFGLGPRPGELAEIDADPRAWIIAQIEEAQTIPENLRHFPAAADILKGIHEARLRSPKHCARKPGAPTAKPCFKNCANTPIT